MIPATIEIQPRRLEYEKSFMLFSGRVHALGRNSSHHGSMLPFCPAEQSSPKGGMLIAFVIISGLVSIGSAYVAFHNPTGGTSVWDVAFVVSAGFFLALLLRMIGSLAATTVIASKKTGVDKT